MAGFLPAAPTEELREEINQQLDWLFTNDVCAYPVVQGGKMAKVSIYLQTNKTNKTENRRKNKQTHTKNVCVYLVVQGVKKAKVKISLEVITRQRRM